MVHRVEDGITNLHDFHQNITSTSDTEVVPIPSDAIITLISSSLEEFSIKASTLFQSDLFRGLLDHELGFKEYWERRVHLEGIESRWVKRVIEYLEYKEQYNSIKNINHDDNDVTGEERLLSNFVIKEDEAAELMKIADYLQL